MAHGKPRDPRTEQQWRQWIQRWQHRGLTIRAFCARHHLSEPSFYAWRRQLQQRQATAPAFVPVQVVPDNQPQSDAIDIVLANGRCLRVTPGFDAAALRRLLAVLEDAPSC